MNIPTTLWFQNLNISTPPALAPPTFTFRPYTYSSNINVFNKIFIDSSVWSGKNHLQICTFFPISTDGCEICTKSAHCLTALDESKWLSILMMRWVTQLVVLPGEYKVWFISEHSDTAQLSHCSYQLHSHSSLLPNSLERYRLNGLGLIKVIDYPLKNCDFL